MPCRRSATPPATWGERFTPAQEGEERDRWAGPTLPVKPGLNCVREDRRTDPAATFPSMIHSGVGTMSFTEPLGEYPVRLTVGGEVSEIASKGGTTHGSVR